MSQGKITLVRPGGTDQGSVVVVVDRGLDALVEEVAAWGLMSVVVGIRQEKGAVVDGESGMTVAGYATVNEFGSEDGRVPERSFIRSTIDERQADYTTLLDAAMNDAIDATVVAAHAGPGTQALRRSLGRLGMVAAGDVQAKIRDLRDPPNAPMTIARKGSSNPLIDTGRMRQSVDSEVRTGRGGAS